MRHVIYAIVENKAGVLAHISGLFSSRGFNIDSLTVGRTEDPNLSRMTIVTEGDEAILEQIRKQLAKVIDVLRVTDFVGKDFVERDLALIKVNAPSSRRNEVIGLVRRITRGIEFTEETMALDLIEEIGPGGEFLTSEHTLKNFRRNWFPDLFSRIPYEKWERQGGKDLGERATARACKILEEHQPIPLEEDIHKALTDLIAGREK